MVGKYKSLFIFVAVIGISCMVFNFTGMEAKVCAQGIPTAKSQGFCAPGKCMHSPACIENDRCIHSPVCVKKDKFDKSECHKINEMLDITRCAKKELLKEKIKANLEKKIGSKLDKVADLLVDAMLEEYKSSMKGKARNTTLEKNIGEVFSEGNQ